MTAFKELLIGGYVLRFWPSDNGWMCGITPQMMDALQQQRTWVGLTKEERHKISMANRPYCADIMAAHEEELKRRNT
jgi:hypothetical protein